MVISYYLPSFGPSYIVYTGSQMLVETQICKVYSSPLVVYTSIEDCILSNNNNNGLFADHVMNPTKQDVSSEPTKLYQE